MTNTPTHGPYTQQDWDMAKKTERRIRKSMQKQRRITNLPPGFVPLPSPNKS